MSEVLAKNQRHIKSPSLCTVPFCKDKRTLLSLKTSDLAT